MRDKIPTPIVDKNGKPTTVHKNPVTTADVSTVPSPTVGAVTPSGRSFASEAAALLESFGGLEFKNNNSYIAGQPETLTLNDMAVPENAQGNCGNVSRALLQAAVDSIPGDDYPELINLETLDEGWGHTAVAVWSSEANDYMVIDFTARGQGESLPFPYIAPQEEWKDTIQEHADLGELQFTQDDEWA